MNFTILMLIPSFRNRIDTIFIFAELSSIQLILISIFFLRVVYFGIRFHLEQASFKFSFLDDTRNKPVGD